MMGAIWTLLTAPFVMTVIFIIIVGIIVVGIIDSRE